MLLLANKKTTRRKDWEVSVADKVSRNMFFWQSCVFSKHRPHVSTKLWEWATVHLCLLLVSPSPLQNAEHDGVETSHGDFDLHGRFQSLIVVVDSSVQLSSVTQSCPTLWDPMNRSTPGLPVHHQLPEFNQTHIHRVSDAIQPSHSLSSPSPPAPNPSQNQSLFQWVNSSSEVAKVLEFQL